MPSENLVTARPTGIPENRYFAWGMLAYVALALGIDTLATQEVVLGIRWEMLQFRGHHIAGWLRGFDGALGDLGQYLHNPVFAAFDVYKFLIWFAIPVAVCIPWMDWGAWGSRRWRQMDYFILVGMIGGSAVIALSIPHIPGVREDYVPSVPESLRWTTFWTYIVWTISWLPGWEFLHRYFLIRALDYLEIKFEWLIVPIVEMLYHLPKMTLEVPGMFLYGFIATQWTKRRFNWLLPFLVHLTIELALVLFLVGWLG